MDTLVAAMLMGIVQGLTEFLPVSSSGHLIIVPYLLGIDDPFITSLEFSVILHIGTLAALLLIYFRADWLRLVPAFFAAHPSIARSPATRTVAWRCSSPSATVPALIVGFLLRDLEDLLRDQVGLVAVMLVVGGAILWLAERTGARRRDRAGPPVRVRVRDRRRAGARPVPGISRSGISIAAGLFLRASAARRRPGSAS